MNQKRFFEFMESALQPTSFGDYCFPVRWAIVVAMVSIAVGVIVAIAILKLFADPKVSYIALAVAVVVFTASLELSIRLAIAHKEIEIKKLDVLKEEIARLHDEQTKRCEDRMCECLLPKEGEPEGGMEKGC